MAYTPLPNPWTGVPLVGALIDAIQNALVGLSGAILSDTYPQAANWLYINTDNDTGSPNGRQLEIVTTDSLAGGGGGIRIANESNRGAGGPILIEQLGDGGILLDDQGGGASIAVQNMIRMIGWRGSEFQQDMQANDNFRLILTSGKSLTVLDSVGNPIFRVDEDGDLHGKTGKALVFDL